MPGGEGERPGWMPLASVLMVETQGGPAVPRGSWLPALAFVPGVAESFGEGHEKYEESYGKHYPSSARTAT